jgi:dihydropteroate synthase type 2
VNLSEDSFVRHGRHPDPDAAIAHALALVRDGADAVDLGAAASNPRARPVEPDEEIRRLDPVVVALQRAGVCVSIDSFQPAVQRWALTRRVDLLNDTRGFPDPAIYPQLAETGSRLVVMHAIQENGKADRTAGDAGTIFQHVVDFFDARLAALAAGGIARERCILDPGMGLFLGTGVDPSIAVLRGIAALRTRYALPVTSVSLNRSVCSSGRGVDERGPARRGRALRRSTGSRLDPHTRRGCAARRHRRPGGARGGVTRGSREPNDRSRGARARRAASVPLRAVELLAEGAHRARREGPLLDEPPRRSAEG